MEKIVYFFGAGFSAPLGLPVMSDFYNKSKQMYLDHGNDYKYFKKVFKTINEIAVTKNYFSADLLNIEEILSIIEMEDLISGNTRKSDFLKYLADVVKFYTPSITPIIKNRMDQQWYLQIIGSNWKWRHYGCFVGHLLNLMMIRQQVSVGSTGIEFRYSYLKNKNPEIKYLIITVNYDMVFDLVISYIKDNFEGLSKIGFDCLAKLHGSISPMSIVPPTWNKTIDSKILPAWQKAYDALKEATQLRILGYSLPKTDSYIKYLFKAATAKESFIQKIDVICKDPYGDVKQRYDDFIEYSFYDFRNEDIFKYFEEIVSVFSNEAGRNRDKVLWNQLEIAHERFMNETKNSI